MGKIVYFFDRLNQIQEGYVKRYKGEKAVVICGGYGCVLDPDQLYESKEALIEAKQGALLKKIPDEKALVRTLFEMIRDMYDGADLDEYAYRAAREKAEQLYKLPKKTFMKI